MIENEFLFLGLLAQGPRHGYDIKRHLKEDIAPHIGLNIKSIYYPLCKMQEAGLIEKEIPSRQGRFPQRYVYRLTSYGRKKFDALMKQSLLSLDRPFFQIDLALYFLPLVGCHQARRRLEARTTLLKKFHKKLAVLQSCAKNKILSIILQHDLDLINAEIDSNKKIISQL